MRNRGRIRHDGVINPNVCVHVMQALGGRVSVMFYFVLMMDVVDALLLLLLFCHYNYYY